MPVFIDEFGQSELSIESRGSGEIQIDTGPPDDLWSKLQARVNASIRFREQIRGLAAKAEREAKEKARRDAKPPPAKADLPPNKTVEQPPPQATAPITGDSPAAQGAPDLTPPAKEITLKAELRTAPPLINRDEPSHAVADQLNPVSPSDIAEFVSPPPPATDFEDFLNRLKRGENEPGEPHPTLAGPAAQHAASAADPVDLFSGAFTTATVDLTVPTAFLPMAMSRSYRSGRGYFGPFGYGWDHIYNVYLRVLKDGRLALWTGQLREQHFTNIGAGFEAEAGYCARLERLAGLGETYSITFTGGTKWFFERPTGWSHAERIPLVAIRDRHGNSATLTYGVFDQIVSVLDDAGRGFLFEYGSCQLLERVTDHTGTREVRYEHDPEIEHLVRVVLPATKRYPDGLSTTYEYDSYAAHPAMQHNILRILDAERRLIVENEFAGPDAGWGFNSVVRQRMAGFEYQFAYEQIQYVTPSPANVEALCTRTSVRPPDGSLHTYTFNYRGDLLDHRFRLIRDGSFRVVTAGWKYDAEGNIVESIAPDGLRTVSLYDSANPNPCARRNLLKVELVAPFSGIFPSRVIFEAAYDSVYQLPIETKDESGARTKFVYDFDLSPSGTSGRLLEVRLPAVVDVDGAPQQSVITFEYNARGQVTAAITAEGGRTELDYLAGGATDGFLSAARRDPPGANLVSTFAYDSAGFPESLHAPGGRTSRFTYNALGQAEQVFAPQVGGADARQLRQFDDSGALVRLERPSGTYIGMLAGLSVVDEFERDELGNVRRALLAANTIDRREWRQLVDHRGRAIKTWNPLGTRMERTFGEDGSLLSETAAAGEKEACRTSCVYDVAARVTRILNAWKAETTLTYDIWGRPHRITLPTGAVRTLHWGANDRLLEERVEEGAGGAVLSHWKYEYDQRGRLIVATVMSFRETPAAAVPMSTRYVYDKDDRVREWRLPRGAAFGFKFDASGRRSSETDPHGNVREFGYDAAGDLTSVTMVDAPGAGARSRSANFIYDGRGRLMRTTFLDASTDFDYDDRDLIVRQRLPNGVSRELQMNAHAEIVESIADPAGMSLRSLFEYDRTGKLVRYVDPMGQATVWERDLLGRTTAIKPPDGSTWKYFTDIGARTSEVATPAGNRVTQQAVSANLIRVTCAAAPGQESVPLQQLTFDGLGRLITGAAGSEMVQRRYDSLGRLIEESARGQAVRVEYDDLTGSTDIVYPDGRRERTEHNPAGQAIRVTLVTPGILGGIAGDVLLEIFYSNQGLPMRLVYGNGVEGFLAHDDHDRLIRVEYRNGGVLLDSCRVRYDENGHRAVVQRLGTSPLNLFHAFDGNARLVEARLGFPLAELVDESAPAAQAVDLALARAASAAAPGMAFVLDDSDTRTALKALNGGGTDTAYISGPDHRITAAGAGAISYSLDGQRTLDGRYRYELDALNRVRRVRSRMTSAVLLEMKYDALSRVAVCTIEGKAFERWFAGSSRIHELSSAVPGGVRQYSEHPLVPSPFCVTDGAGAAYVHQDQGWSTMCVTSAAGSVLEHHRYDAFGGSAVFAADRVTPLSALRTEARWRGMMALGSTTLFEASRRLYDPELGAFTGRDPLLYIDSPSPYVLAAHNPVDFADPSGLAKMPLGGGKDSGKPGAVQTLQETVITAEIPFEPAVSYQPALEAARGRGHIESGDVRQFINGGYNGLINILPLLLGPVIGPMAAKVDIKKAPIDPRYGGAGIVGEQLTENLALEAALAIPSALSLMKNVFTSRRLVSGLKAPVFWALGAGGPGAGTAARASAKAAAIEVTYVGQTPVLADASWAEYQIRATGTAVEDIFRVTENGVTRDVMVDALTHPYLVEAKFGNMGQMWNLEREEHVLQQAANYLKIADARGLRGVRYAVSTELGAQRLLSRFTLDFAAEVASGKLSVWWVP